MTSRQPSFSRMALYNAEELLPPPKAMFRITTAQSVVRGLHGADIVAQHGVCVRTPVVRPTSSTIKVWETPEGVWWQDQLATTLSTPDHSINCFALQHDILAIANVQITNTLGVAIAQQLDSWIPGKLEGTRNRPLFRIADQHSSALLLFRSVWLLM